MLDNKLDFDDDDDDDSESWLTSYSDMMTDLLAVFVILFAFAMMSTSYKNAALEEKLSQSTQSLEISGDVGNTTADDDFDKLYEYLKDKIEESGYENSIAIEKTDEYIKFHFQDSVLFLPDSKVIREESYEILSYMGEILLQVDESVGSIDITGHVADVGEKSDFDWELSAERAFTVLKYFANDCGLPEDKMSFTGRGYYDQVAPNDNVYGQSLNRRVEIKVTKKKLD